MAIKVTLGATENTQQEKPFPKLMKDQEGEIYYFVRDRYGLPLTNKCGGFWSYNDSDFSNFSSCSHLTFTDYNEPITIQNL
jgi:hypothetical protein